MNRTKKRPLILGPIGQALVLGLPAGEALALFGAWLSRGDGEKPRCPDCAEHLEKAFRTMCDESERMEKERGLQ